jgi:hypothetical protein
MEIKTLIENLLKKEVKFQWNEDCHKGLDTLKHKLLTVLILIFLLALDLVLGKLWPSLAQFWTSTRWSKKESPGRDEITDITHFLGLCGPNKGPSRVL